MTVSLPFQNQFSWRKLGYLFFTDSLAYREVLEQNPQWRVNELPPLGAQLRISPKSNITNGLTQGGFVFGLPEPDIANVFPFSSELGYVEALVQYSLPAVLDRDRINGFSIDSAAVTN